MSAPSRKSRQRLAWLAGGGTLSLSFSKCLIFNKGKIVMYEILFWWAAMLIGLQLTKPAPAPPSRGPRS
jgi:hypothetical protein